MIKYLDQLNKRYDRIQEPYRFLIAMFIMHPLFLLGAFPNYYTVIGTLLVLAFGFYRAIKFHT